MDIYSVHVLSDASVGLDEIYQNRLSNYGVAVAEKLLSRIHKSMRNLDVFPERYPTHIRCINRSIIYGLLMWRAY